MNLPLCGNRVAFDKNGPRVGTINLVVKTIFGFKARSAVELGAIFVGGAHLDLDVEKLADALRSIATAMNSGDLGLAAIATGRLPVPSLSQTELAKAEAVDRVRKASPDDPKHPGYPKGAPEGRGGQFRPKDGTGSSSVIIREDISSKAERLERLVRRRTLRSVLTRVLTGKRVLRLVGENVIAGLTEPIPGIDVVTDAAALADDLTVASDIAIDIADSEAAIAFVEKGPLDLDGLRVDWVDRSFETFDAFKKVDLDKAFGPAGDGFDYHHIVEQASSVGTYAGEEIQSTLNIVRIPRLLHEEINSIYATPMLTDGEIIAPREYLRGKSFKEQYDYGISILRRVGILQ